MDDSHKEYRNHYLKEKQIYPSVFALKLFLGNNPNLSLQVNSFKGKKILDVGFGDGRVLRNSSTASLSNNHNIKTIKVFDRRI